MTTVNADRAADPHNVSSMPREFRAVGEGRYVFAIPDLKIEFDLDRLRRERHEFSKEKLIAHLERRFAKQGARVSDLTARLQRDLAQVTRTRIALRKSGAALRALIREAESW